ncbi:MAG: DUF4338 domain-containing protein, partial [Dehalococcoidales bacterium]|nr:DUF4338 domain-containing protein [Dehalococcoidales bacterium]
MIAALVLLLAIASIPACARNGETHSQTPGNTLSASATNLQVNEKAQSQNAKETGTVLFGVKDIFFSETDNPNEVLLTITLKTAGRIIYQYEIYFPPQAGMSQAIGPLEVQLGKPGKDDKILYVPEEVSFKEYIARSYPDNHPEFARDYAVKLKFYLADGTEREWLGRVGWQKAAQTIQAGQPEKSGTITSRSTGGNAEMTLSFPSLPNLPSWELELQREWVPELVSALIWGYEVYLNYNFYGDYPAVYTPKGTNSYTLTDPQSLTIRGLAPGSYYVDIYPLGIYFSPNLVTPGGKRYAYAKLGIDNFSWAWIDQNGRPISSWAPLSRLPETSDVNNPGYFFIYKSVFS